MNIRQNNLLWVDIIHYLPFTLENDLLALLDQKCITFEHYLCNPQIKDYNWNLEYISSNTSFKIMLENKHRKWRYDLANDFKWEYVSQYNDLSWNYYYNLSKMDYIDFNIIVENNNKDWDWFKLSYSDNINIIIIKKLSAKPWDWKELSKSLNITYEDVQNNKHLPWDYNIVEKKILIDPKLVSKKHGCYQNPKYSIGMYIPVETMSKCNLLYWGASDLMYNLSLTLEFIENNNRVNWDYSKLSEHPCITLQYISEHSNKPWDYYTMSKNPNITMEYVNNNKNLDWDWNFLIKKFNLTIFELLDIQNLTRNNLKFLYINHINIIYTEINTI